MEARSQASARTRSIEATLLDLVDTLYESTLDESAFPGFIESLAVATGSHFAGIEIIDRQRCNLRQFESLGCYGLPRETLMEFNQGEAVQDPFVDAVADVARSGDIYFDTDVMDHREYRAQAYYQQFLRHYEFEHLSGLYVIHDPSVSVIATTSRGRSAGPFGERERELFRRTLPHLQRFFRLLRISGGSDALLTQGWQALDHVSHGVALLDRSARCIHLNPEAQRLVDEGDAVRLRGQRLLGADRSAHRELESVLSAATRRHGEERQQATYDVTLPRARGGYPVHLQCLPLYGHHRFHSAGGIAALACLYDPARLTDIHEQALESLYRLTRNEARVAALLAGGHSLESIAETMGHSIATTRTVLKRVFSKTGTHRQNELTGILLRGPLHSRGA